MLKRIILSLFAIVVIIFANYQIYQIQSERQAHDSAVRINRILIENFEQVEKILITTGRAISNENPNLNLEEIYKIFVRFSNVQASNQIFSWTLFDWVGSNHLQTVSTIFGVNTKDPRDMSDRFYTPNRGVEKWSMIFSEPVIGSPSKVFVIPVGVQISTPKYSNAGIVTAGININKLRSVIERNIDDNSKFLIIDRKSRASVFGSNAGDKFEQVNLNNLSLIASSTATYSEVLDMDSRYPYFIVAGYDSWRFWVKVFSSSLMQCLQIFITVILLKAFLTRRDQESNKES